jgi:hypothetical protein
VLLLEVTARNPGRGSAGGNGLEGRGEGVASSFWKTHPRASLARGGGRTNSDSTDRSSNHASPRNRASSAPVCQIAFNCDAPFASNNDPVSVRNGRAETGGAEPRIAEQSRSWRAAGGEREAMRGS